MDRKIKYEPDYDSRFNFLDDGRTSGYQPPSEEREKEYESEIKSMEEWIMKVTKQPQNKGER